ncbi:glycosyltransferase family 4 protein, partial [bacterium]|nr:glycosyltransferase family 4 protein [bacterium]
MLDKKLTILMVLVEPPLPFGNAASRWFHVLLNGLDRRGHRVDVLVASGVDSDIEKAKKIFSQRKNFFIFPFSKKKSFFNKLYTLLFPHRYMFGEDFYKKLQELNPKNYDIIHIEQTWAGWMGFSLKNKALINVHHLQSIDLEYVIPKTFKEKWLYKSWFLAEKRILTQYPYVRICSPRLEPWIKPWGTKKILKTVPVSLDLSLYPFIPSEKRQSKAPIITVIGNMTWYPSISAAERLLTKLWPSILKQIPNAQLRVVGWSARQTLKNYLNLPNVEILENVPDIQPYFEQASVMVYAPARGSGMKIKILESLAFGIPVVTTSEGSEGLPAQDMLHMGLCDDDAGLIE